MAVQRRLYMTKQNETPDDAGRVFVQTAMAAAPELDRWKQVGEEEAAMVAEMTRRNELSGGTPVVRAFEKEWREWIGAKYGLSVLNGTSALYSAYFGLGVGPGDEVICPVNTWICTIAPAVLLGARPVFCDVDPESLLMDPEDVRKKITKDTRCIVSVHLWGNVCDMDAIMAVANEFGIPVVEDCSHAHGAKYNGKMCGAIGAAGCWSMQGSKPVSAGEGGMLVTDDMDVFERACLVGQVNRIAGVDLVCEKYADLQPLGLGMKFRAHPLGIGVAKVQWGKLAELNHRRKAYVEEVEAGLRGLAGLRPVKVYANAERGGYYGFPILHDPAKTGNSTEQLIARIKTKLPGAAACPYPNLHTLPLFAKGFDVFTRNRGPLCPDQGYPGYRIGDFPHAEVSFSQTIMLPILSDPVPGAAGIVLDILREATSRFYG
jgi:perosamine synthetase